MDTTPEKIAAMTAQLKLMQAYVDGQQIQFRGKGTAGCWWALDHITDPWSDPTWDFSQREYRIKPAEPRTFYLILASDGKLIDQPPYASQGEAERDARLTMLNDGGRRRPYTKLDAIEVIKDV